jgi:type I restriction enzyme S subunit
MAGRKSTQALENHARLQASVLSEELPPGYKMTELGPLPEEWRVVRLERIAHIVMGQSPPSKTYNDKGIGLPFFQGKAEFGEIFPTPKKWCTRPTRICPAGSILLAVRAPVGDVNLAPFECCIGRGLAAIYGKAGVHTNFLFYWFLFAKHVLEGRATGTTFKSINRNALENLLVPLPPLPEQRAIAHVLRTVQRAKEATERVIAALRELKKSLMSYLFTYGPVPVDQADQVALKETEIGPVPEEWEVVRLGDLVNQGILWMKNGFPQGKHNQSGKGIIHLRPFNINEDGYIDISQKKFVDPPQKGQYWVLPGDVIFNNTNSEELVGKTAYFDLHGNFVISNHMTIIRVVRTEIIETYYLAKYLHQLWRHGLFRKMCRRHVNQASVSLERLKRLSVPLPPLSEQRAIAEILRAVDRKIEAEEARQRALEALFRTLLHDLMTARLRLPPAFIARFAEDAP